MTKEHCCIGIQHIGHRQATAKYLARKIRDKVHDTPSYTPKEIQDDFRRMSAISVGYNKAHRAKTQAKMNIDGSDEDSYRSLPKYGNDLQRNNPVSTIVLETTITESGQPQFKRMFICYDAVAIGFAYCCPIIGLDGTHLKTRFKGVLLAATSVDANGSIYPLASAVVSIENGDNWLWFTKLLHDV
jgi:hypothetical protein